MVCAMNSVYKFMDFIDCGQAVAWLKELTSYSFSLSELVQIYKEGKCRMYLEVSGIRGAPDVEDDDSLMALAVAQGFREVIGFNVAGDSFKNCEFIDIRFSGPYHSVFDFDDHEKLKNWSAQIQKNRFEPFFLPADIEALAAKINSHNQVEEKKDTNKSDTQQTFTGDAMSGISFPYSTEKLRALADAANKYWANYTPDKKKPTKKDVSLYLCELLGKKIPASSEIPRDISTLAAVIIPDGLD